VSYIKKFRPRHRHHAALRCAAPRRKNPKTPHHTVDDFSLHQQVLARIHPSM
jgi:hypothetical protein